MAQCDIELQNPLRPRLRNSVLPNCRYREDQEPSSALESPGERSSGLVVNRNLGTSRRRPSSSKVYLGSYADTQTPPNSRAGSRVTTPAQRSISHIQLDHLLSRAQTYTDTFDINESRDGFFDATFYRPSKPDVARMLDQARDVLPASFQGLRRLSFTESFWVQWRPLKRGVKEVITTRAGVKLFKSFLAFFVAYVICLIPASGKWLGPYNYILVVSCIINHPGRAIGPQIDGALLTILGSAVGLAWGSLALYVSTSTTPARTGYGGILATFLILFTWTLAWLRCIFIRFYHTILCAGFAVCYVCLANTSEPLGWKKIASYGIPWALGQAMCLVICMCVFPGTGMRQL